MWLTDQEADLFSRMPPPDQVEGLAVAGKLEAWGWGADRDLLVAGVLHDVGKSLAPGGARYRVLMTALETLPPALVMPLASRGHALAALANHAAAGSQLASQAGLPDDVALMIRMHHQPPRDARMEALQRADALY
jgi:HD-like signal output (HDOD) protein